MSSVFTGAGRGLLFGTGLPFASDVVSSSVISVSGRAGTGGCSLDSSVVGSFVFIVQSGCAVEVRVVPAAGRRWLV